MSAPAVLAVRPPPQGRRRAHTSVGLVLAESFRMFNPRREIHRPVMFAVYVYFWFLLVVTLFPAEFPDIAATFDPAYYLAITIVLFLTLWFSHLAEAIAEAQGKAQADSLREIRSGTQARVVLPDGRRISRPSEALHLGDTVEVLAPETIPMDGDVVQGAAQIDESMMTGESEPVVRESGGDKTSVLGGTKVVQGRILVKVTAERGQTFLDRMIHLVESTRREKTPNELALDVVLAAFTLSLIIVVLSFVYVAHFVPWVRLDLGTLIALFVCLIPTTIGALLPAIGISGITRVSRANIVAKSGRAVEAAGDLDVIILDKTGTITVGNRLAVQFVPAPEVEGQELLNWALLASSLDDTPEGRSIVRLAGRRGGTSPKRLETGSYRVVPFSAERRMSGLVLTDGTEVFKGSITAMENYGAHLPASLREAGADAAREGMTPLAIAVNRQVLGLVLLKDVVKPGVRDRIRELKVMGIRSVMVTGDNRITAAAISKESGVDEFLAEARPETKLQVIRREKSQGRLVAMSGDGTNDAPALAQADVGLAMNSGTSAAKEAGNMVDLDNDPTKLIEIVSIGKQLLITRGALTTFSITNDVAKYFAIIPAIFVLAGGTAVGGVAVLNFMQLTSPHLAVLAAILFNGIIIPILNPLALTGVRFRPRTAIELLRTNLVLYGVGGLVSAFVGIKVLYVLLAWLGGQPLWQAIVRAAVHVLTGAGGL
jgi:K+-transporting ATPase ATPase B chain